MAQTNSLSSSLPIISLYVFTGYRLMPATQQIYYSFTQLTYVGPTLDKLVSDIKKLKSFNKDENHNILSFDSKITLKNINYNYHTQLGLL